MTRLYWQRTWVIQEVLIAKEVIVFCGNDYDSWQRLIERKYSSSAPGKQILDGVDWSDDDWLYEHPLAVRRAHIAHFFRLADYRRKGSLHLRLWNLMMDFQDTQCFDPRDKVYAFLSLDEHDVRDSTIVPDYSIDLLELFIRVLDQRIENHGMPSVLRPGHATLSRLAVAAGNFLEAFGLNTSDDRARILEYLASRAIETRRMVGVTEAGDIEEGNEEEMLELRSMFLERGNLPESRWKILYECVNSVDVSVNGVYWRRRLDRPQQKAGST